MELFDRFFKPPKVSFFLFGPRGTGKSTFVNQFLPDSLSVDLLDPERVRVLSALPERLKEIISAYPKGSSVIIDEIQRIPSLLPVIHSLLEQKKDGLLY
jgi:predicted AAA+ superfamily ATPase